MKEPAAVEASGLTLAEARDVLDYWENAGYRDLKAAYEEGQGIQRARRPSVVGIGSHARPDQPRRGAF